MVKAAVYRNPKRTYTVDVQVAIADVADKFGVKRGTLTLRNRLRRPQHFQLDITLSICTYNCI
jgi:hypothetical protein